MRNLRKNASLAAVATNARRKANAARKTWLAYNERARTEILSWDERCRKDAAWKHYADLNELAEHLERLTGTGTEKSA